MTEIGQEHNLYRHFDAAGSLLYVGISYSAFARLAQHRGVSHWYSQIVTMTIEKLESRAELLLAEESAIKHERPLHNIVYSGRKRSIPDQTHAIESKLSIIRRVVFKPVYTVKEAAECLSISGARIRDLVACGRLGSVNFKDDRKNQPILISGWQIIDLLGSLGATSDHEAEENIECF